MRTGIIAAISTPPGKGGVALIRISGEGAHGLLAKVFVPISNKKITDYPYRHQIYGYILSHGERCDDGMLTLFPAGASYTGEEMAELTCHGGTLITQIVLEEIFSEGAMPAEPGEFTRRAFVNGKLSLTEAEAIGSVLDAVTDEQVRLSALPMRRALRDEVMGIRSEITHVLSSVFARIDYPEEDLGELSDGEVVERLTKIKDRLTALTLSYRTGKAIMEGIRTVIVGKPNAGKSTLYNTILGEEAAIVTSIPGTTRDLLVSTAKLGKITLQLTDTAGIRTDGFDEVEAVGIERAKERILESELILAIFDSTRPLDDGDQSVLEIIKNTSAIKICLINKCEENGLLGEEAIPDIFNTTLHVSLKTEPNLAREQLAGVLDGLFTEEKLLIGTQAVISSSRQHSAARRALEFITTAIEAYNSGLPADYASSDIELALGAIAELDGRAVSGEVVDGIFKSFCVGK